MRCNYLIIIIIIIISISIIEYSINFLFTWKNNSRRQFLFPRRSDSPDGVVDRYYKDLPYY